ncbi:MAG TPA: cation:proton antiporter [Streptosporangiaceae bacterium]
MTVQYTGLLVVAAAAFVAPVLAGLIPRRLVPPVVLEVLAGVAIGPQGLDLVHASGGVYLLYVLGFGFLLFLAGQEVDPARFRGPAFRLSAICYAISVGLGFAVAAVLSGLAAGSDLRLLALSLTASSLGVLVPVLRDAGAVRSDFGQLVVMSGSVGEFASLLLLTILFSAQPEPTAEQILYVAALGVAGLLGAVGIRRFWQSAWMSRVLLASDDSTSQLRVRGAFVILLLFAGLAHRFGVDALLGAFVAGIVLGIADSDDRPNQRRFQGKLQAIGYGFLVPVFFVVTGVQFNLRALFASTSSLVLLPALVVAILVVRGGPAVLFRRRTGLRPALAAGLLQATTLTFPVVAAEVGLSLGLLSSSVAAALIGASLVSVLLFPALALALRPWSRPTRRDPPGSCGPSGPPGPAGQVGPDMMPAPGQGS